MGDRSDGGARPLTLCIVLTLFVAVGKARVTEEDLLLLSEDRGVPHCFSRNLKTITCYCEAEELPTGDTVGESKVTFGFYYFYENEPEEECDVTVQNGSRTLYVCEHDDVRLFNDLHVLVKDRSKNLTLSKRRFEVGLIAIIQSPSDIKVLWEENSEQFHVTWEPPEYDMPFLLQYEVQYWSENLMEKQQKIVTDQELQLPQLTPGLHYHLRVRTSWMDDGPLVWGPWSEAVTFDSPQSADCIGLTCYTSDLSQVCCKWGKKTDVQSFYQAFYRYSTGVWQPCEDPIHSPDCNCVFLARDGSTMSLKLNVTSVYGNWSLYYAKPFWVNHIVLPSAPELNVQQLPGNQLALNWSSSLPGLGEHLMYQIRFSEDSEKSWTTLQVPAGIHHKLLTVIPGTSYILQIRASPGAEKIQGFWSEWSPRVTVKYPSSIGWITPVVILCVVLVLAAGLCVCCIFPSFYRKLKDKLWPPLPNLHRVLDSYLTEIRKQYQPSSTLYEKPLEEAPQPSCLEILCEVTLANEGQQTSRDYVQLSPPSYQNEDYWPKIDLTDLSLELNSNNQPSNGVTNQTYLPTGWSLQYRGV
ncbi:thrombopoietin receptor [Mixophyes fleayi]|uniref:thrombopoietin receptor n=1 Tax=Mixophyes fleayi TaxID=3061075 RepID=UPI003F4DCF38